LNTLNSKTGEMQVGIEKLQDGSQKVTAGLNTLNGKTDEMKKGIDELRDGSEQVTGGLNKLVSKSGELKAVSYNNWRLRRNRPGKIWGSAVYLKK
ncbi:hypothetical protein ACQH7H_24970, partial [Escherichia coli]|uniref:hypothetical protein n=1 Tax=Escherichia coli TaxID=562 RepID=UPI003CEAF0AE